MDAKDFDSKGEAFHSIERFDLTPTMLVSSGSGYHCYYVLDKPLQIDSKASYSRAKRISYLIHGEVNGDHTFDLGRILRLPGTYNVKDPTNPRKTTNNQDDWTKCEILHTAGPRYSLSTIEQTLPDKEITFKQHKSVDTDIDLEYNISVIERVPKSILMKAKNYWTQDRSVKDYHIIRQLVEEGFTEDEIIDIFCYFRDNKYDASEKWATVGDSYLLRTIRSAKQNIEGDDNEKGTNTG